MSEEEVLHPGHGSIRLKGCDYSSPGLYFVTICAYDKRCIFGRIIGGRVDLAALGQIARESWIGIPSHFARANLHGFVIMPNHVHGIVEITCQAGAQHAAPLQRPSPNEGSPHAMQPSSLSAIVRSFKAAGTKRARLELNWATEIWQRNYFERIIRDGQEFSDAHRYIMENPIMWERDRENPKAKTMLATGAKVAQQAAPLQRDRA